MEFSVQRLDDGMSSSSTNGKSSRAGRAGYVEDMEEVNLDQEDVYGEEGQRPKKKKTGKKGTKKGTKKKKKVVDEEEEELELGGI